jgi:hypothetical protein
VLPPSFKTTIHHSRCAEGGASAPKHGGSALHSRHFVAWNNSAILGIIVATPGQSPIPRHPGPTLAPRVICGAFLLAIRRRDGERKTRFRIFDSWPAPSSTELRMALLDVGYGPALPGGASRAFTAPATWRCRQLNPSAVKRVDPIGRPFGIATTEAKGAS